ncbi:hypothetical protein RJ639_037232 [Escallonia herrerae]|uniref:Uncharacterized protein n=1 Tax=Escallonia herrerae TaxID=1293975 RepID=A0AA88WNH0_9ASTE|nr:hypothetical protein RJ639_037232 [Escallonia herrerae]
MQPPRSETLKAITELEKEIASLETANSAASRTVELRKKQFALLLHVNTIEEGQKSLIEEMRAAPHEHKNGVEYAGGCSEAMVVD